MVQRQIVSAAAGLLLLSTAARALTQDVRAAFKPLSVTASTPSEFIPPGWTVEEQISGDLNGDGKTDLALKLVQEQSRTESAVPAVRQRALVILLGGMAHQWRGAALATKLLQCTTCGGALYGTQEAPAHVAIVNRVLIVKQDHGSRNVVGQTFRFRYQAKLEKFLLIGVDLTDRDRANGALVEESTNFLTGQKLVTNSQFDERRQKYRTKSSRRSRVAVRQIAIEDVDYEHYDISTDNNGSR
jgi:hypothetical protein